MIQFISIAVNRTSWAIGQLLVIYCPEDQESTVFAMEQSEFERLFEPVAPAQCL